ncbi:hypothetical protein EVAR_41015_1 [Eumeta japonica]|uniref:Uncharacterized protein n=1 Tax=Eumeta variegata TaxID=151549 RepID=A0A4C1Z2D2_EUMVA|nr:hypothetical protein EVAR_41015_1 [Eumeta japonica]
MRIDATRLFGAEIVLGNRIIRLEGPAVTAISAIAACPHPGLPLHDARFLWSADFLQCGGVVNNGQRFLSDFIKPSFTR